MRIDHAQHPRGHVVQRLVHHGACVPTIQGGLPTIRVRRIGADVPDAEQGRQRFVLAARGEQLPRARLGAEHDLDQRILLPVERVGDAALQLGQSVTGESSRVKRRRRLRRGPGGLRPKQVVLFFERSGELTQSFLSQAQQQSTLDDGAQRLVERISPEPGFEALFEQQVLLDLVEGGEAGRQACLEGVRTQELASERVNGRDGGEINVGDGSKAIAPLVIRPSGIGGSAFERLAHPVAQFGRGRLGEGDSDEAVNGQSTSGDEVGDARDQHAGFAGARASLDEEGPIEVIQDLFPRGGVCERWS